MRTALLGAAAYNFAWGTLVVLFPLAWFRWAGMAAPSYPQLWQCIGMIVGVYGLAYACAAFDPVRLWPIIFAGLLGKVLAPIGFLEAALAGELPWRCGWVLVANDLLWWVPFALILRGAWQWFRTEPDRVHSPVWQRARTEHGEAIGELSFEHPILLVVLRHAGCAFCREALSDVSHVREALEATGMRIVLAHMGTPEVGAAMAARYGLGDLDRVADPNRLLYHALGLSRGSVGQLFAPRVWWRACVAGILEGHGLGLLEGDGFQMGGVFLLHNGRIVREFRYQRVSDRPDFAAFRDSPATSAS